MDRITKSNLLATLKELNKASANRRKIVSRALNGNANAEKFMAEFDDEFNEFCDLLKTNRKSVKTASNDISEPT